MNSFFGNTFNNSGHIHNDASDRTQRNVQNTGHVDYMLSDFMLTTNPFSQARDVALDLPNVNYSSATHGLSHRGDNIDVNSELLIGSKHTREAHRVNLGTRMFNSVPYMGKGRVDPDVESAMMQAGELTEKKSDIALSEADYTPIRNYPLIDSIESTVSNPNNLVEESADGGWVRGGVPSRSLGQPN